MTVTRELISRAAAVLREGGLVAFPTETVYGLGADASSPEALRRLYDVKGRPAGHPVIVHLADATALGEWAGVVPPARLADLDRIPTWDEWDPDRDRWYWDWHQYVPRPGRP